MYKKHIITLLTLFFFWGCAANSTVFSLEEVEKHRLAYIDGKEDAVAELVKIFQDQAQASDVRMAALSALKDSRHPMAIEAVQQTVGGSGFHIGAAWSDDDYLGRGMNGYVGHVLHYTKKLTSGEVFQNYNATKTRYDNFEFTV